MPSPPYTAACAPCLLPSSLLSLPLSVALPAPAGAGGRGARACCRAGPGEQCGRASKEGSGLVASRHGDARSVPSGDGCLFLGADGLRRR